MKRYGKAAECVAVDAARAKKEEVDAIAALTKRIQILEAQVRSLQLAAPRGIPKP
jgi:hypothetical protein